MNKFALLSALHLFVSIAIFAQVGINTDNSAPDNSAMLDVKSNSKGFLPPRMTQSEIMAIQNPSDGLIAYCLTDGKLYVYVTSKGQWKEIPYGAGILGQPFPCGTALTINHIAGNVAPVSKTVTYGTVTNILGEPAKCWITHNLGSDQQATAANDPSEASAGWYWQFNRMQGYKHDGTTRTPGITWPNVSGITDWQLENDPCRIELGGSWRIPTATEWTNVDAGGSWTGWDGPWSSDLKLHVAGSIYFINGSLIDRGYIGYYWSSSNYANDYGWMLYFTSGSSLVDYKRKGYGGTIRCLRE